ncbi:hypothetical protein BK004_03280 [bacterium CG10_46_32]|nr:MAG: hypothetical protein BK004_03280 [bacterium CG10_46_32]
MPLSKQEIQERSAMLKRIFEQPSKESQEAYHDILRHWQEGMPVAWRGAFLSSCCTPLTITPERR